MKTPLDFRRLGEELIQFLLPQIEEAYKALPASRQIVLDEVFGIQDGIQRTLQDTGDRIGKSKQRIHRIKDDAMNKLLQKFFEIVKK